VFIFLQRGASGNEWHERDSQAHHACANICAGS
jgi:hypothetical protein